MNEALKSMLRRYQCRTVQDYENALKEIIQEIALLGLWRSKFFEHAAFYGGTALRIFYGLDRFSEDLDFSLLKASSSFSLQKYHSAVRDELSAFGIESTIKPIEKAKESQVQSAFIKAGTLIHFLAVGVPNAQSKLVPKNKLLTIKFEVDISPPKGFETEAKTLLQPIPFAVNTYSEPDLLAGKLHAVLCRAWETRVKGRDWYDFAWFVARNIPVRLSHLEERLIQSKRWRRGEVFNEKELRRLLNERIDMTDLNLAKRDVGPFLKDPDAIKLWSKDFFRHVLDNLKWI